MESVPTASEASGSRARERRSGPWRLLALPQVYNWFQHAIAVTDARAQIAKRYIRARPGDRVLDIGCGPAEILRFLPSVDYVGVDLNSGYLEAARAAYPAAQFFQMDVRALPDEWQADFDLVLAQGLLHHFSDEQVVSLLRGARAALKGSGRLVCVEVAFDPHQPRIARWLAAADRGRFVRTVEQYRALAASVFPAVRLSVRHDLMRIPYTHLIIECGSEPVE
jgi:SAM-dependent methyltransferase